MQQRIQRTNTHSLKSRLVLSYLIVILGTVLILIFAATLAAESYFHDAQIRSVQLETQNQANGVVTAYRYYGNDWASVPFSDHNPMGPNIIEVITDNQGNAVSCNQPQINGSSIANLCTIYTPGKGTVNDSSIKQIITQAINTNTLQSGDIGLQYYGNDGQTSQASVYTIMPLQTYKDGPTIGYLFLAQPQVTFDDLLTQIRIFLILAGLGSAAVATFIAYLLINGITKPLNALTMAAERMKRGQYTVRAPVPSMHDELGQLALTFNEMADTIEADVNELRQQDQMRRDLIANIAHDLATPLTAIQGLSEALADDVISDRSVRQETSQRISREVQRLRRMVAEVRQMTQMEAGQIQMDLAPLDLHSQVDETVAVIAPECEQMGVTLENAISSSTPQVLADSDRITQVLLNLLDNARRHTKSGGTIRVTATPQGDRIKISVQDTGVGIAADDLPHIFERFYRADRSRTTQTGGGSGLGLAIVKAIITAHGGQVQAESQLGQGTTISFTLPVLRAAIPARANVAVRP